MKVYLIGAGMGTDETMTKRAAEIINKSDIIIGADRLIKDIKGKEIFNCYKAEEIKKYLDKKDFENAAILLSGDVGFYSGAKRLLAELSSYDVELIAGISSAAYFCARLKKSMEDIKLLSLHGKKQNIIGHIRQNKRVFALLSGGECLKEICRKLCLYNMGDCLLYIGQRLSYEDEKIICARADEIKDFDFDNLLVLLAENKRAEDLRGKYIEDAEFLRGDVPMTKSEVRIISIAKLGLKKDSVLYDIGAGTGSVAVEAALKTVDGTVFAIEKNEKAVKLIESNKIKFAADNIEIIKGTAPEALKNLPTPTHAFIGGSSGSLREITKTLFNINPDIKIVINANTLNTVGEAEKIAEDKAYEADVVCINAAKGRLAGNYRLMVGQNPVYIFTLKRHKKED